MSPAGASPALVALGKARLALECAWRRSDAILCFVAPSALGERPILDRPSFLSLGGHLPAFAWIEIGRGVLGRTPFAPALDALFERGPAPAPGTPGETVDSPSWAGIAAYRDRVRRELRAGLDDLAASGSASAGSSANGGAVRRGAESVARVVEHEARVHEGLLAMLARLPARRKIRPADLAPPRAGTGLDAARVAVAAGPARLGPPPPVAGAAAEGDRGMRVVDVPAFTIDSVPVRNADFLRFVEDGGYDSAAHWTASDAAWRARAGLSHPLGWTWRDGSWTVRTAFEDVAFDDAAGWPACVSLAEARAYARWRGARLPTEAEWHRAAYGSPAGTGRAYPWGDAPPTPAHGAFDVIDWSPSPVGSHPWGASAWGIHELAGNGWEWTETVAATHAGSAACRHACTGRAAAGNDDPRFVLCGGSWATSRALLGGSLRHGARADDPFVFSKFRLVW